MKWVKIVSRCVFGPNGVGVLSILSAAWVWYTYPYYAWIPLMLYVAALAAATGLLAPKRGLIWIALQVLVGGVAAHDQVSVWLDPTASPVEGSWHPLGFDAKLFIASLAVGAVCALVAYTGTTWLLRRVTGGGGNTGVL